MLSNFKLYFVYVKGLATDNSYILQGFNKFTNYCNSGGQKLSECPNILSVNFNPLQIFGPNRVMSQLFSV